MKEELSCQAEKAQMLIQKHFEDGKTQWPTAWQRQNWQTTTKNSTKNAEENRWVNEKSRNTNLQKLPWNSWYSVTSTKFTSNWSCKSSIQKSNHQWVLKEFLTFDICLVAYIRLLFPSPSFLCWLCLRLFFPCYLCKVHYRSKSDSYKSEQVGLEQRVKRRSMLNMLEVASSIRLCKLIPLISPN